jgi:hypothetical protein
LAVFRDLWGNVAGPRLYDLLEQYRASATSPHRQLNRPAEPGFIDALIDAGEARIREWHPRTAVRDA